MSETPGGRGERIKELFASAISVGPAARVAVLDEACAGDAELRNAVEDLLENYDSARDFFARFPPDFARQVLGMAPAPRTFSPGDLVAGRFHIVGFLGAGGMGEVYEAEDQLLDRQHVALKTLPADVAGDALAIVRLKREMALARQVTHMNVCRVFDVDQHVTESGAAIAFFTMELLEGETLAERLERTGALSTTEARPLVSQMVAALGTAHAAGIVHGDFKPGNVVLVPLPDGGERLVVTDFGLARRAATDPASRSTSRSGPAWGTPRYMAPEQFAGQRPTRATDVYALAAVVLEMVTGKEAHPFEPHAADEKSAVSIHESTVDPSWPSWRPAILRGLDHNPEARFQTVDALLSALSAGDSRSGRRWRWGVGVACTSVALALLFVMPPVRAALERAWAGPFEMQQNVAVLPFTSADGTPEADAFSRGLAAAITDQLDALLRDKRRLLFVPGAVAIDGSTSSGVGGDVVDRVHRARQVLGADLVVTGRVDRAVPPRHITLSLYDASAQRPTLIATQPLEIGERARPLPAVRAEVARMLGMHVALSMPAFDATGSRPAEAEEWYVRGRGYLEQGRPPLDATSLDSAIGAFERAIALDAAYAPGYSALGDALTLKYQYDATHERGKNPQMLTRAEENAGKASGLQPSVARFHVVRAMTYLATGRHPDAIAALTEALRIDPDEVTARASLAESFSKTNQPARAERTLEEGVRRHPRYWSASEDLGAFHFDLSAYKKAEIHFRNGLLRAPDNPRAIANLAALYTFTELTDAAEQELIRGVEVAPGPIVYNNLAWAYFFKGDIVKGVDNMEKAVHRLKGDDSVVQSGLARGYRWQGRKKDADAGYAAAIAMAVREIEAGNVAALANLAYLYAETGNNGEALRLLQRALSGSPSVRVVFTSALVHERMGRRPEALDALKSAIMKGHSTYQIAHHPDLEELRKDRGYQQLLREVAAR